MVSISPQAVSRILKSEGFIMTPNRDREGTLVSRGLKGSGTVLVSIQNDSERRAKRFAEEAAQVLRAAGYSVEVRESRLLVKKIAG
jgi:hypothetical protein